MKQKTAFYNCKDSPYTYCMLKTLSSFIILFALADVDAKTSYVSKTQTLTDSGSELFFGMDYFQPSIHSNHEGTLVQFDEGESYQRADFNLLGHYAFSDHFQASVGLRLRYIVSTELIDNEDTLFTKSGVESTYVGFKYSFPMEDGIQYSFEANYRAATYTNDEFDSATEDRSTIVLGDGGTDVSLGLGVSFYSKSQNFLSSRFLYRNPASTLSSEIFSEIEGAIVWPSTALIMGIENVYSLNQDPYTSDTENKPEISNGSTSQFNSINRSWTAPYAGIHFSLGSKWRVEFKALAKMYGVSTDLGNIYTINLARRVSNSKSFQSKNSAFKEYRYEGSVQKITKKRSAVVVDMGLQDGLKKGDKVDFYHFDYIGGNQLIASGYAIKVSLRKSIVKITKRFSKLRVEEGTVARAGIFKN